ncbi:MAG: hypothetical protein ACFFAS_00990 [Promethearchaeota archaeon]
MPREIELTCPSCQTFKIIKIPDTIFDQKKFGTIKIQVPTGAVCSKHQFIAFVDTKGIVRGYERIDLLMGISLDDIEDNQVSISIGEITLKKIIKKYGIYGIFSLLHAKLFNYPAYIIQKNEQNDDQARINDFFNNNLPDHFKEEAHPITFLDETDYNKIKIKEKNAFLIDSEKNILQTPWIEKLKFEESILKKALDIIDTKEQLIIIKQEISKFITEAEHVRNILESVEEIYQEDLIEKLSSELKIQKINRYRLNLIKDYINQRYSEELTKKIKNKVQEFLNLL